MAPLAPRAFPCGWFLGLCVAGAVVIVLIDVVVLPSGQVRWLGYVKVGIEILLVLLVVHKWISIRSRSTEAPDPPGWMSGIESMSATRAFELAFLLAALNPKKRRAGRGGRDGNC
jgi:Sap-like sulfolipid-1-addressing protein